MSKKYKKCNEHIYMQEVAKTWFIIKRPTALTTSSAIVKTSQLNFS